MKSKKKLLSFLFLFATVFAFQNVKAETNYKNDEAAFRRLCPGEANGKGWIQSGAVLTDEWIMNNLNKDFIVASANAEVGSYRICDLKH